MVAARARSCLIAVVTACGGGAGSPDATPVDVAVIDAQPYTDVVVAPTMGAPGLVAIGDLDGDGLRDLAVTKLVDNSVSVFLNRTEPGKRLTFGQEAGFEVGPNGANECAAPVAIGDLDGDGKPDLAVVNCNFAEVAVLLNETLPGDEAARFSTSFFFPTMAEEEFGQVDSLALADLDGDGKLDIIAVNGAFGIVGVFLNTTTVAGSPTFATRFDLTMPAGNPLAVGVADFNGDGKLDIATAEFSSTVAIFLNTTATGASVPSFAAEVDVVAGTAPSAFAVGDFDGDGRPDLALTNLDPSGASGASILVDTGSTSTPPSFDGISFPTIPSPTFLGVGDIDGDGKADLIVGDPEGNVVVLPNGSNGAGVSFGPQRFVALLLGDLAGVADLDGDGHPEIVVTTTKGIYVELAR